MAGGKEKAEKVGKDTVVRGVSLGQAYAPNQGRELEAMVLPED